jgi:hypothetical protein
MDSQNQQNVSQQENVQYNKIIFKDDISADENLKVFIVEIYEHLAKENATFTTIVQEWKRLLDEKFGKNWIICSGTKLVIVSSYVQDTLIGFELGDVSVVIFKTYAPEE